MNELLQKHGCANVFSLPEGLKELMSDISREVLREQPARIYDFITNYLSVLLITREHGILAVKILEDLCDCQPTVSEHLMAVGLDKDEVDLISYVIKQEIENFEPVDGKENLKEIHLIKKIMNRHPLDEVTSAKVCQIARNAYRDYWYRKKVLQESLKVEPDEPWEIAAQRTLDLYKRTKPSFGELTRATVRIQAAYKGYHVRKKMLKHVRLKIPGPRLEIPGPPIDIAGAREIDLGPLVSIKANEDPVVAMFHLDASAKLGLRYDTMKTITLVDDASPENASTTSSESNDSRTKSRTKHVSLSRAESFVQEVLDVTKNKGNNGSKNDSPNMSKATSRTMTGRSIRAYSISNDQSATGIYKTISFSEMPPELIPNLDEDEIPEDIPDSRTEGDGASGCTSSDLGTADLTDFDEVEEALDTPHTE